MAEQYAAAGVKFVFVYTREAHPGERYPHLSSMAQKVRHATDMARTLGLRRPMLVDDLEGAVHHAYGRLPNMSYVVGGGGRILYRASWTDPDNIRLVLDRVVESRRSRRQGTERRPYYVEWEADVVADRVEFCQLLLRDVGPKAVREFIDAMEHTMGAGVARPMRQWWETVEPGA
jgi:hypothetical protein